MACPGARNAAGSLAMESCCEIMIARAGWRPLNAAHGEYPAWMRAAPRALVCRITLARKACTHATTGFSTARVLAEPLTASVYCG